jgi:amidophosphoribosyltransferase
MEAIHLRISNPELRSHCPWGKTTKRGETLVSLFPSKEDRIKSLGVDSLEYNTIDDLIEAIGLPRDVLCVDCDLD